MSTPSDSIATDASVVDDDASIARRATDDFLSDAVSALRVSSREPARRVVLCPVVDDDASVDAVRWALRHLVRDGDALHILHVLPNRARDAFEYAYAPPSSAFAASPVPGTRDDDDDVAARRRLDRARARRFVRERFGDVLRGTPYVLDITTGGRGNVAIGELICAVAEAVDADAVCMSTRDRGPVARFFVGSVANYCLRNATMPVVMVRPGERAKTRRSRVVFDDER
tara:strand:+ start:388 stop:1071 length:684 start_codon:yes stop_codon:yes gene_type:complete